MAKVRFDGPRVYTIAEIGMTHDGSFGLAKQLTAGAIESGADIVKYQCHIADAETLRSAPPPPYFSEESRFDYFSRTAFSAEQYAELVQFCHDRDVLACISVFSLEAVDVVAASGADIIKIPSGEVSNIPMLRHAASTGLPVIMSSGMSDWASVDRAVETFRDVESFCLVQCSSIYPCPPEEVGLNLIQEMQERYSLPIGLSDHSLGGATAVAAVALGAKVIEKHFTLSKGLYGPDARFSLDLDEFKRMTEDIQFVAQACQSKVSKDDLEKYAEMKRVFEKSIVIKGGVKKGDTLGIENLSFKKPGTGISAECTDDVQGRVVNKTIEHDTMLQWEDMD